MSVVIETTIGDITVDLFIQDRPQICKNFLKLCSIKYYNHCSFHYVQRDFIAQTGDPTGSGNGGESVYAQVHGASGRFIQTERKPKIKHDRAGLISMVNNGENLHGSQFFFTLSHTLDYLDNVHSVFGEVVEGQDVIVKLNEIISDENNRPYQDILITHTVVLDDPYPPIEGLTLPSSSPEYNFEDLLKTERIGVGEELFDVDKPPEVLEEEIRDKEAKQRALVLEMIGDLPDADAAPPENVLFICKLNPITAEEDLEIIFSRFGKIVSCEIIKDEVSGDSLQYGFIEFDCKENCEKAYFKMDNVLIDDRRIHVDFSQSVSKMKWKGKGRIEYQDDKGNWSKAKQRYNDRPQHYQKSHPHQNNPMRSNRQRQRSRSPPPPPPPAPPTDKRRHRSRTPEKHRRRSPSPDRRRSRRSRSPESNRNRRDRSRSRDRDRRRDRNNDGHTKGDHHASSRHHQKRHDREEYSRDQDRSRRRSRSSERHHRARN